MLSTAVPTFNETIGPWLPLIGLIASGLIVGAFSLWNRRHGNVEVKAPSVDEAWERAELANAQLDIERRLRRWFELAFWTVVDAFRGYQHKVGVELTAAEKNALEATPPVVK